MKQTVTSFCLGFINFKKKIRTIKNLNFNGETIMQIENIKLNREKNVFHGELNFVDYEFSKDNCKEMLYRLLSWKLGPVEPTRHFELSYNDENERVEIDVFVSVTKPKSEDVDTVKYIFSKLMEFTNIYQKELYDLTMEN